MQYPCVTALGPDDAGLWRDDRRQVVLAHRRLGDSLRATAVVRKILSRRLARRVLPAQLDLKRKQGDYCRDVLSEPAGDPSQLLRNLAKSIWETEYFPELLDWFGDMKFLYVLRNPYAHFHTVLESMPDRERLNGEKPGSQGKNNGKNAEKA